MPELKFREPTTAALANTSLRIIAAGMVVTGLYYASSVVVTLVLAVFIAFVLDPGVKGMERLNLPRWLGSLLLVLLGLAAVYLLFYVPTIALSRWWLLFRNSASVSGRWWPAWRRLSVF